MTSHRPQIQWIDLGGDQPFQPVRQLQLELRKEVIQSQGQKAFILSLSHQPTITLGFRSSCAKDLKKNPLALQKAGIAVESCERGGGVTYHGPGQLMIYPIVHLPTFGVSIRQHIANLQASITSLGGQIRDDLGPGVWLGNQKLASIGVHVSRGVTIHGLCLNIRGPIPAFDWINPCGQAGLEMAYLAEHWCQGPLPLAVDLAEKIVQTWCDTYLTTYCKVCRKSPFRWPLQACSSGVERYLDMVEVGGSKPPMPTSMMNDIQEEQNR